MVLLITLTVMERQLFYQSVKSNSLILSNPSAIGYTRAQVTIWLSVICREYWTWKAGGQSFVSQILPYAPNGRKIVMVAARKIVMARLTLACVESVTSAVAIFVTLSVKLSICQRWERNNSEPQKRNHLVIAMWWVEDVLGRAPAQWYRILLFRKWEWWQFLV